MQTILIDVDTQEDFCAPGGALFVRGADALYPAFRALVRRAVEANAPILGSMDSHAFDAWEFAGAPAPGPNGERPNFPPHCVKGTPGWLKVPGTMAERTRFVPNVKLPHAELDAVAKKHAPQMILLEKEVYSLFANPNAEALLDLVVRDAPRFVVYGVATDYCVRAATLGLVDWLAKNARGGEVWLVTDAIAAVAIEGGARAVDECVARGAKPVTVSDALGALGAS